MELWGSLSLSLDIAHTFRSDLMVTLISPAGTHFSVTSRQGDSQDNLVIVDQAISAFDGEALAGIWQLIVRDLAKADVGTLNSWSLTLRESCGSIATAATYATTLPAVSTEHVRNRFNAGQIAMVLPIVVELDMGAADGGTRSSASVPADAAESSRPQDRARVPVEGRYASVRQQINARYRTGQDRSVP